ncbi:SDR family NAD(P)-dependent oxidoreductase [Anaerovibrio lipolyticus]|uniref:SDR family NAD(P)-dependent oxidoreductase n=1 Tax=Anaerovibrio lipolyticus TaxID=82374 RepID=UPI0004893AE2|nr:SDR family oxidoreductase [Anaerovibrio lipolyticus]
MLLRGKNAVITGCNRGIGKEILKVFANNGANVFACVRNVNDDFLQYALELSKQNSVKIFPVGFDLLDERGMKTAVMEIRAKRMPIDILVNNAGVMSENVLFQMDSIQNLKKGFDVNFFAQIHFTQYISRLMMRNSTGGSIVFISSIAALDGVSGQLGYAGAKAALVGSGRTLAAELGRNNIRVNIVAPGLIATDMGKGLDVKHAEAIIKRSSLGRWGKSIEVANTVLFLASDLSSYITGQIVRVDGGKITGSNLIV